MSTFPGWGTARRRTLGHGDPDATTARRSIRRAAGDHAIPQEDAMPEHEGFHGFTIGATDGDIGTVTEAIRRWSYTVRYIGRHGGGWRSGRCSLAIARALTGRTSASRPR
jgi:hypothetical protein